MLEQNSISSRKLSSFLFFPLPHFIVVERVLKVARCDACQYLQHWPGGETVFLAVSWNKILNFLVVPRYYGLRVVDLFNTQALQKTKCALESTFSVNNLQYKEGDQGLMETPSC